MKLQEIWNKLSLQGYASDKGDIHSYLPVYEEILAPYRETAKNVLEIGLFHGHSLRMWEQYFTNADVYGIDCSETPHDGMADLRPMIAEGTHNINIMDACNKSEVKKVFEGKMFDCIIEDAGHAISQQFELYSIWKKYLSPNGIYIIEDVQDIDNDISRLKCIDPDKEIKIIDRRYLKNRYDDVLIIIH
jgi:hypothetical protein